MIYARAGGSTYCQWPYVLTTENPTQKVLISFHTFVPLIDPNTSPYFKEPNSHLYETPDQVLRRLTVLFVSLVFYTQGLGR